MRERISCVIFAVVSLVQGVAIGQVTVDGPTTATAESRVTLDVGGLPAFDLTKPIGESLAWADRMRLSLSSPDDKARLDSAIGIDFISRQWRLTISFIPKVNGTYVVAVADPLILIQHRIQVGGEVPRPDPIVPVVPVKNPQVYYLRETKDAGPMDAALVISIRAAFPKMLILDKDASKLYDQTKKLPQLVVMDGDNVVYRESSPADLNGITDVVKRFTK